MSLRRKGSALGRFNTKRGGFNSRSTSVVEEQDENFNRLRLLDISAMAYRKEYIIRWLWYAFDAFDDESSGSLSKMQLKMLTAHLGSARLAVTATSATTLLKDVLHDPTDTMTFKVFSEFLASNNILDADKLDLKKLEEACWMLCNKTFTSRTPKLPSVMNTALHQLWRLFNFYSEPDTLPPCIAQEEAACLTEKLLVAMGTKYERDKFEEISQTLGDQITMLDYLRCLETHYLPELDDMCVSEGLACVHRSLVVEQEKMGYLKKKGHKVTSWRERWFILKLGSLSYFVSSDLKDQKGEIDLRTDWTVEMLPDNKSLKNMFVLFREDDGDDGPKEKLRYELQAPDPLVRQEWISALKYIIKRSNGWEESDHWKEFERRHQSRVEKKRLAEEAEKHKLEEEEEKERNRKAMEDLQKAHEGAERKAKEEEELRKAKELEEQENRQKEMIHREKTQKEIEKLMAAHDEVLKAADEVAAKQKQRDLEDQQRRKQEEEEKERLMKEFAELQTALQDAEKKADIEAALKVANQQRKMELESSLKHLEGLLLEETQAKQDEEIVRRLQARLLEEETEKREELEKLKEAQDRLLEEEQEKRQRLEQVSEELQNERLEQQKLLEQERQRLLQLENDRKSADEQLKEAMDKLIAAEKKKQQEQRRKRELERPVGLARLIQPRANPLKSHRGEGAFTESQFDIIKQLRKQWRDKGFMSIDDVTNGSMEENPTGGETSTTDGTDNDQGHVPKDVINGSVEENPTGGHTCIEDGADNDPEHNEGPSLIPNGNGLHNSEENFQNIDGGQNSDELSGLMEDADDVTNVQEKDGSTTDQSITVIVEV